MDTFSNLKAEQLAEKKKQNPTLSCILKSRFIFKNTLSFKLQDEKGILGKWKSKENRGELYSYQTKWIIVKNGNEIKIGII